MISCPTTSICDYDCALRYIPVSEHVAIKDGTSTYDAQPVLQQAINEIGTLEFPTGTYCLNQPLVIPDDGSIRGWGSKKSCLKSEGTVICFGNSVDASSRENEILDICIDSGNADYAIKIKKSRDFQIKNASVIGGIEVMESVGGLIRDSRIIASGRWAIVSAGYSNGLRIHANTVTGGSGGGAINVRGPATAGSIKHNIIESSKDGIFVSSSARDDATYPCVPNAGVARNFEIVSNYIEASENPIVIGREFVFRSSYVNHNIMTNLAAGSAGFIQMRRVDRSLIEYNTMITNPVDTAVDIEFRLATDSFSDNEIRCNNVEGNPANYINLSGPLGANASMTRNMGGNNYIDNSDNTNHVTSKQNKVFYSKTISSGSDGFINAWLKADEMQYGGKLVSAEIVEVDGDVSGYSVSLGSSNNANLLVPLTPISSLTFVNGCAELPLSATYIESNVDQLYSITSSGTGGTFRLKIIYRVS